MFAALVGTVGRPVVRLALANVRKARTQMLALAGFATLASVTCYTGLVLATAYPASIDAQVRASAVPDVMIREESRVYSQAQVDRLAAHPGVVEVEHEPLHGMEASFAYRDGSHAAHADVFVARYDAPRDLDVPRLRGQAEPLGDDGVYLPYFFRTQAGYSVGDTLSVDYWGLGVDYTVRGFTDEMMFWYDGAYRFYVGDAAFASLPGDPYAYLKVRTAGPSQTSTLVEHLRTDGWFAEQTVVDPTTGWDGVYLLTYADSYAGAVRVGMILASFLLVAAGIVGLVSLVVVRFRVAASIEESMTSIGVLKAVGYTSGQVAGAVCGQFCAVAGAGAAVGVAVAHAVLPRIGEVLSTGSTRFWTPGFSPSSAVVTLAVVTVTTLVAAGTAAARVRRLSPTTALRTGLAVHSFRRNPLPLATSRGRLVWLLAGKSAAQATAQTVTVGVVVAAVAFMGTTVAAAYENVGLRSEGLLESVFGEIPDLVVTTSGDADELRSDIARRDGVRAAALYARWIPMRVDGAATVAVCADDFGQTEGNTLYEGRWPQHGNEAAISWRHATALGVGTGGTVSVAAGDGEAEYLVTGLIQSVNNGGAWIGLTTDGVRRVLPQYQHRDVYVYLDDRSQAADLLAQVDLDETSATWDYRGEVVDQAGVYGSIMLAVSLVVALVAAAVVALVVLLVMSMAILRGRRNLGIQKAVGFTTAQLVGQVVTTYLPVTVAGAAVGATVGHLAFGSLMDAAFRTMGLHSASMHASTTTTVLAAVSVAALTNAVALLVATRVRKVSPCALVVE